MNIEYYKTISINFKPEKCAEKNVPIPEQETSREEGGWILATFEYTTSSAQNGPGIQESTLMKYWDSPRFLDVFSPPY